MTTHKSEIQFDVTNKGFVIIKQSSPQVGQIVLRIVEIDGFIGMLRASAFGEHGKSCSAVPTPTRPS